MTVLDIEIAEHIAVIRLNRPEKRNAINPEMMVRLADAWTRVREDDNIRVAVLAAAGDGAFCAGGDLKTLIPLLTRARPAEDEWDERLLADQRGIMNGAMLRTTDFPKPIVCAIEGLCVAGGMELMLATDLRVASVGVSLALTEVQRGLIPGGGSVARLPRQAPTAVAMEILLLGEPMSAERAHQVGLVNRLVSPGHALEEAMNLASRIAANAPLAVHAVKRVGGASPGLTLDEAFRLEDEASRSVMRSADAKEGARAFVQRRAPHFVGS